MKKKEQEIVPKRTLHLDARVTQEEYDAVKKRADECGKTVSKYTRECTLGHQPKYHLTEREIEVLRELVSGASNKEIGDSLSITENTVKMHITNMLQKTGYHSRLELAVKARHLGVAIKG